ncbi:MAG: nucleoside-diphosphate kinase [Proteobacteria bacterium]|nr:nucleoside-diphosphate kinase [Pseudomonadota bacterium]
MERTLSIIKPDAIRDNAKEGIINMLQDHGFIILQQKDYHMTEEEAKEFYSAHESAFFFQDLVNYMISGPITVMLLEAENAVLAHRELMGATNPKDAKSGTIRARFGKSIEENAIHGSDSIEAAKREIDFFFHQQGLHE